MQRWSDSLRTKPMFRRPVASKRRQMNGKQNLFSKENKLFAFVPLCLYSSCILHNTSNLSQTFLIKNGNAQGQCLIVLRAGIFTGHHVVGSVAYTGGDFPA